ncbi:hypothetical protein SESBI_50114, partial [Sesbania bispinosa]
ISSSPLDRHVISRLHVLPVFAAAFRRFCRRLHISTVGGFDFQIVMSPEKEASSSTGIANRKLSCSACFDALWFCYSPVHQMQQYYRLGVLDNCSEKWRAMVDCFMLKTKPASQVQ